jgi:Fe-S cluster assembly protein SufD
MNSELRMKNNEVIIHDKNNATYIVEEDVHATIFILLQTGEQSVTVRLVGQGAEAQIIGVGLLTGNDQTRLHTLQHHEAPETTSNLLVKAVLTDAASFIYDGSIFVDKKAQKTNAYQRNENLLLSNGAHAQSKPALEILANDVRCTHGATISTVDQEQLFYLASRGLNFISGKKLLVEGFLEAPFLKLSATIQTNKIKESIWQILSKQLL